MLIEVRGLRKTFGSLEVLRGIDLDMRRGEVVVIIGPSGSGKSTLLRCLNRLEDADGRERADRRRRDHRARRQSAADAPPGSAWSSSTSTSFPT